MYLFYFTFIKLKIKFFEINEVINFVTFLNFVYITLFFIYTKLYCDGRF